MSDLTTADVGWKLRTPCDDCPFKRTTPLHSGVMNSLPEYEERIKEGRFAHTCHKTDSRADGYVDKYDGQIQHCAGSLILFNNMEKSCGPDDMVTKDGYPSTQAALIYALVNKVNLDELVHPDVFSSFTEMVDAYRPMIEEKRRELERLRSDPNALHISFTNRNGKRERIIL